VGRRFKGLAFTKLSRNGEEINVKKTFIYLIMAAVLMTGSSWGAEGSRGQFNNEFKQRRIAHREQQKQENQAFRQSLRDLAPTARTAASKSHRTKQYQENQAFSEALHQERLNHIQQRLEQAANLSEDQKAEILNRMEAKFQISVEFREQQHPENLAFLDRLQDMEPEARKQAMKDHREARQSERKAFHEKMKSGRQAFRHSIRGSRAN
jgi:hypothetical protein